MPSFLFLFYLMIWYFKFLHGCFFFLLICLLWRPPLLLERCFSSCSPFPCWKGSYSGEGKEGHIFYFYLVCLLWPVSCSKLSSWCPWNMEYKQFEGRVVFYTHLVFPRFPVYSHYAIKVFVCVCFGLVWLDDCLTISVTIIKCKSFTTLT